MNTSIKDMHKNYSEDKLDHICDQYEKRKVLMCNYMRKKYASDASYREKCKIQQKKHYEKTKHTKDKSHINKYQKDYRDKNGESIKEYQRKYRAKKKKDKELQLAKEDNDKKWKSFDFQK